MSVLGIDIAKRVLHAVGMDERGKIVLRKRLSRHDLMPFLAKLPPVRIGMEACGGAQGIHLRRDNLSSIAYSEELISSTISATLQSTDRHHGIVGHKRFHFQLNS